MQQPKAKYKLSNDAVQDLRKLDQLELALRTITASYNELRDSTWLRMRANYYLKTNKQYRFNSKAGLIVEV